MKIDYMNIILYKSERKLLLQYTLVEDKLNVCEKSMVSYNTKKKYRDSIIKILFRKLGRT